MSHSLLVGRGHLSFRRPGATLLPSLAVDLYVKREICDARGVPAAWPDACFYKTSLAPPPRTGPDPSGSILVASRLSPICQAKLLEAQERA